MGRVGRAPVAQHKPPSGGSHAGAPPADGVPVQQQSHGRVWRLGLGAGPVQPAGAAVAVA